MTSSNIYFCIFPGAFFSLSKVMLLMLVNFVLGRQKARLKPIIVCIFIVVLTTKPKNLVAYSVI